MAYWLIQKLVLHNLYEKKKNWNRYEMQRIKMIAYMMGDFYLSQKQFQSQYADALYIFYQNK